MRWRAYDGIHHDEVIVAIDILPSESLELDLLDEVVQLLEDQGVLDLTVPIYLRPRVTALDDHGISLGTTGLSGIEVSWDGRQATVLEPQLLSPSDSLVAIAPDLAGMRIREYAVTSRQAEPLAPTAEMDNSDKERDHLPAVVKNLDLDRPLVSVDAFVAARADTDRFAEAESLYAELQAADAAHRTLIESLRAEVAR